MIIVYTNEINLVFPPPRVLFSLVCIPRDTKKPVFDPVFILAAVKGYVSVEGYIPPFSIQGYVSVKVKKPGCFR